MSIRILRCRTCGFMDGSTPTTASTGDRCTKCKGTDTVGEVLRTL